MLYVLELSSHSHTVVEKRTVSFTNLGYLVDQSCSSSRLSTSMDVVRLFQRCSKSAISFTCEIDLYPVALTQNRVSCDAGKSPQTCSEGKKKAYPHQGSESRVMSMSLGAKAWPCICRPRTTSNRRRGCDLVIPFSCARPCRNGRTGCRERCEPSQIHMYACMHVRMYVHLLAANLICCNKHHTCTEGEFNGIPERI